MAKNDTAGKQANRVIEVVPYNPQWIETFQAIKAKLWPDLSKIAVSIEHVGSTSVPGLWAKPIVDIAIIVETREASQEAIKILQSWGYQHRGNLGIPDREAFKRPDNSPVHNLYVAMKDCLSLRNHLALKNHLTNNQEAKEQYANLKRQLASQYPDSIDNYCEGKTEFIIECLEKNGFQFNELNEIRRSNNIPEQKVSIEIASIGDVQEISDLMQSIFGPNPQSAEAFTRWIKEPAYHVSVAKVRSKIVGVASSYVNANPQLSKYEPYGEVAVDFLRGQKLGWFLTLAVLPAYRKSKIGWSLAEGHLNWLKSQGCTGLVGSSWVTGSLDNSSHMFIKAGFQKLGESNVVLRAELQATGATCGACKKALCECSSILYGLRL